MSIIAANKYHCESDDEASVTACVITVLHVLHVQRGPPARGQTFLKICL